MMYIYMGLGILWHVIQMVKQYYFILATIIDTTGPLYSICPWKCIIITTILLTLNNISYWVLPAWCII